MKLREVKESSSDSTSNRCLHISYSKLSAISMTDSNGDALVPSRKILELQIPVCFDMVADVQMHAVQSSDVGAPCLPL